MSGLTSRVFKASWIASAVAATLVGCVPAPEPSGLTCAPDAGLSGAGSAIAACPDFPWEGAPTPVDTPLNVVGGALLPDPAAHPANEPLVWPEADPERPNHLGAVACGCDPVDLPIMAGDVLLGFNAAANGSPRHTFDGRPAIAWHDHRTAIGVRPLGCDPGRTLCGPPQPIGRFLRTVRTNASLSRVGQHPPAPVCVAQVGDELHDRCAVFSPGCQTGLQHDPTTGQAQYSARTPACIVTVDEEFACDADCSAGFGREVQRLADLLAQQRQLQAVNAAGATPMPVSIPLGPNQQVAWYLDNTLVQPLQAYTPVQEAFIRLCGDRARAQRTLPDNDVDGVCDGGHTPGGWFAIDNCPDHPNPAQADGDHDAVGDACDNCPLTANAEQHDHFGRQPDGTPCPLEAAGCTADATGDACGDVDADGVLDATDNCPLDANPEQADLDGDGQGDPCDPDRDGDGVPEPQDNCPEVANADQRDFDEDGAGDACDGDKDGDGVENEADNCPAETPNPGQEDTDGDGFGDHCDAPLLVERCAPDQVQADDGACRPTSGIRLSHLFLEDYVPTPVGMDPEPIDLLSSTLRLEEQSDAFFLQQMILAAAPQQDEADQLPVPAEPDQPPVRHRQQERLLDKVMRHYNIVRQRADQIGQVYDEVSDLLGYEEHVMAIVSGLDYEAWAMGNYCYSWEHSQADVPCMREVRVPRYLRDFDVPDQPRLKQRADGTSYHKHRRYDCLCPPVGPPQRLSDRLPPLAMEAKITSSPEKPQYSYSYEAYLLEQCLDYRFHVARLYLETFPHLGDLRAAYAALLHVGGAPGTPHASADASNVAGRGRAVLMYYLSHPSGALRRVMERCGFPEQFPGLDDHGLMPQHGSWDWRVHLGLPEQLSAADRLIRNPHLAVSAMRWQDAEPGVRFLHDAVANCGGQVQWKVMVYWDPQRLRVEPRLFSWCIPEEDVNVQEGAWRLDNIVETRVDPTLPAGFIDGDLTSAEWGNIRVAMRDQPVCPPYHIDDATRQAHEAVLEHDGRERFLNPLESRDFLLARAALQALHPTNTLVRVPIESRNDRGYPRRVAENFDMTLPGYWLMMDSESFLSHGWAEDMMVRYLDPWTGDPDDVWTDQTERRDTCKD